MTSSCVTSEEVATRDDIQAAQAEARDSQERTTLGTEVTDLQRLQHQAVNDGRAAVYASAELPTPPSRSQQMKEQRETVLFAGEKEHMLKVLGAAIAYLPRGKGDEYKDGKSRLCTLVQGRE